MHMLNVANCLSFRAVGVQACQSIYPLKDVYIRKVKTLKAPKFDITKLMEVGPALPFIAAARLPCVSLTHERAAPCATASNSRLITMATDHVLLLIPMQSSHSVVALHLTLPSKGDRALPSTGNVHVPRAALAEPLRRAGARQRR